MYEVLLDNVMFPVAPSNIEIKIVNKNKSVTLIDEGEINILKKEGLKEVRFDVLLPSVSYPFAKYKDGFKTAGYYLEHIRELKTKQKYFTFKVIRQFPDGRKLFGYNMVVSLEEYTIKDDVSQGFDIVVSIKLKEYRTYATKVGTVTFDKVEENSIIEQQDNSDDTGSTDDTDLVEPAIEEPKEERQQDYSPVKTGKNIVYHTTNGITTLELAKKYYGLIGYSDIIEDANKRLVENGIITNHYIQPNTSVIIPELKEGTYVKEVLWDILQDGEIIIEEKNISWDTYLIHYNNGPNL